MVHEIKSVERVPTDDSSSVNRIEEYKNWEFRSRGRVNLNFYTFVKPGVGFRPVSGTLMEKSLPNSKRTTSNEIKDLQNVCVRNNCRDRPLQSRVAQDPFFVTVQKKIGECNLPKRTGRKVTGNWNHSIVEPQSSLEPSVGRLKGGSPS